MYENNNSLHYQTNRIINKQFCKTKFAGDVENRRIDSGHRPRIARFLD